RVGAGGADNGGRAASCSRADEEREACSEANTGREAWQTSEGSKANARADGRAESAGHREEISYPAPPDKIAYRCRSSLAHASSVSSAGGFGTSGRADATGADRFLWRFSFDRGRWHMENFSGGQNAAWTSRGGFRSERPGGSRTGGRARLLERPVRRQFRRREP